MTVSLDLFFPSVQPHAPNCPTPTLRNAIRESAIEFCEKSLVITVMLTPIPLVDATQSYAITPPEFMRMVEITEIFGPQLPLTPVTMRQMIELYPNWQTAQGNVPAYYMMLDSASVTVVPIPTNPPADYQITPRIAVAPTMTAAVVHDDLYNRFSRAIAHGAKYRLKSMTNQPWSDPKGAVDDYAFYRNEIDDARIEVMRMRTAGSMAVAPVRFG